MNACSSDAPCGLSSCSRTPSSYARSPTRSAAAPVTVSSFRSAASTVAPAAVRRAARVAARPGGAADPNRDRAAGDHVVDRASAISRPRPITTSWSAVSCHLAHQVAGHEDRAALGGQPRMSVRTQRMPSGSSPFTGSSNISTRGSPSSAPRCRAAGHAEGEAAARLLATPRSPTRSSTSSTRWRGCRCCGQGEQVVARRRGRVDGRGRRAARPPRAAAGQLAVRAAADDGRAGGRAVQPEDHPHGGGLAGAVGPEETGHPARSTSNDRSSTATLSPNRLVRSRASISPGASATCTPDSPGERPSGGHSGDYGHERARNHPEAQTPFATRNLALQATSSASTGRSPAANARPRR